MDIPSLQPGCPWYELRSWKLPNVKWCEASMCSWVTEPANTWSNLTFIVFGLVFLVAATRSRSRLMRLFGFAQVAVGVFSLVYHASYTFVFQVLDFVGMYLFCSVPFFLNLIRTRVVSSQSLFRWVFVVVVGMTLVTVGVHALGFPIQGLILLFIFAILGTEVWAQKTTQTPVPSRFFYLSLLLMAVGATFSALDASRIFCDPDNHLIQGHALWHIFTSTALVALYFHYRPFGELLLATQRLGNSQSQAT